MDARIEELQKVAKACSWLAAKEAFARLRFQLSVRQQMKYPERQSRGGVGVLLGGALEGGFHCSQTFHAAISMPCPEALSP